MDPNIFKPFFLTITSCTLSLSFSFVHHVTSTIIFEIYSPEYNKQFQFLFSQINHPLLLQKKTKKKF